MHWSLKMAAAGAALGLVAACAPQPRVAAVPVVVQQPVPVQSAPVVIHEQQAAPAIPADATYYYHRRIERLN